MNILCTLVLWGIALIGASARPAIIEFNEFTRTFNKSYSVTEYDLRYDIFRNNLDRIQTHNQNNHSWKLGINQFADLTADEFRMKYTGVKPRRTPSILIDNVPFISATTTFDHRKYLPPIKDQSTCGSCWAFSAVASIEGATAQKSGKVVSLSEQQLVDCSGSFGNFGCNGGLMDDAFMYIETTPLYAEDDYPYKATDESCHIDPSSKGVVQLKSHVDIPSNNGDALFAIASERVVSVAIEADESIFQFYTSGIIDSELCGTALDHGVAIVGGGHEDGKDYWLVRNSWGQSWGLDGYVKIARTSSGPGVCGINSQPSYPIV